METNDMASYEGGAKRSSKLPRYELIDPTFLDEVADVFTEGAAKYGELNWQKGEQDYVQDIPRHMLLHVFGIMNGDTAENHLGHLMANCIMMAKLRKGYPYIAPGEPEQLKMELPPYMAKLAKDMATGLTAYAEEIRKVSAGEKDPIPGLLDKIEKSTRDTTLFGLASHGCLYCGKTDPKQATITPESGAGYVHRDCWNIYMENNTPEAIMPRCSACYWNLTPSGCPNSSCIAQGVKSNGSL